MGQFHKQAINRGGNLNHQENMFNLINNQGNDK